MQSQIKQTKNINHNGERNTIEVMYNSVMYNSILIFKHMKWDMKCQEQFSDSIKNSSIESIIKNKNKHIFKLLESR